jgi:[ribosomal protein S5]-alanine N-acetyltransferase
MGEEPWAGTVTLRPSTPDDASVIFQIEADPEGRRMAAFGGANDDSELAFRARWERMLADSTVSVRTVLWSGNIVGSVYHFPLFNKPSVAYWIAREVWGKRIATRALTAFLQEIPTRPLFARVATDNVASRKVLENCGFRRIGVDRGFARFRGAEIEELIYRL